MGQSLLRPTQIAMDLQQVRILWRQLKGESDIAKCSICISKPVVRLGGAYVRSDFPRAAKLTSFEHFQAAFILSPGQQRGSNPVDQVQLL